MRTIGPVWTNREQNGPRWPVPAASVGTFLVIWGVKLYLIGRFASPAPFMDEWDGEGASLFVPFLSGHLTWHELLAGDNEHRILLTRLLSLIILRLGGVWDIVTQMVVNAALHALALVVVVLMVAPRCCGQRDPGATLAVLGFTAVVCSIPFGWDNLLLGFNTHFFLLVGLSTVSVFLIVTSPAFSRQWLAGTLVGTLSLFSVAAGAVTLVPAGIISALQLWRGARRSWWWELSGILVLAAITAFMVATIPTVPETTAYRAQSVAQFMRAFLTTSAWPLAAGQAPLTYAPLIVLSLATVLEPPPLEDRRWRLTGLLVWVMMQAALPAYSRAPFPLSSRYEDILLAAAPGCVAAALLLPRLRVPVWMGGRRIGSLATGWLVLMLVAYGSLAVKTPKALQLRMEVGRTEETALRQYLVADDDTIFQPQEQARLHYPDADRLRAILVEPTIRAILPAQLGGEAPRSWMMQFEAWLPQAGAGVALLGVGLLAAAVLGTRRRVTSGQPASG